MTRPAPWDARVYAALLRLYPPAFQTAFLEDMVRDFLDARAEAEPRGRVWLYVRTGGDLGRSLPVQWWRTGWPVILCAAALVPIGLASTVAAVWPRDPFPVSPAAPDRDGLILAVLAIVVLFVIFSTILITLWANQFLRRRRRT